MLNYIQNLPEAKLWAKFPQWLQVLQNNDAGKMIALLQSFSADDHASMLSIMRAIANLGRQAQTWLCNDKRYEHPGLSVSDMLKICRFVSYEETDITKQWQDLEYALPKGPLVLKLLQLRKPDWFAKVYYHHLQDERNFDYSTGIALERMGFPVFSPAKTAAALAVFLRSAQRCGWDMQALYSDYPEIFSRDIWTLFSEKTQSLGSEPYPITTYCQQREQLLKERYPQTRPPFDAYDKAQEVLGPPEYEPYSPLAMVLLDGIAASKLGRERVLRETLLGICRNLERDQPTGFAYFFTVLQPTPQELLDLQDELIAVLGCTHTKPITTILKYIKTIISHDAFNYEAFIQALPVLLCSKVKSLYTVALSIAEDLAKHCPPARPALSHAIASMFSTLDGGAQEKAAKILSTYGDAADAALRAEVSQWRPHLTVGAIALLGDFLAPEAHTEQYRGQAAGHGAAQRAEQHTEQGAAVLPPGSISHLDEDLRITVPHTLEECLFLLAEAFGNPAEYHCSLVPDALLAVREQLDDESLHLLGPAITAARKEVCSTFSKVHVRTPALHFLRYCIERLEATQIKSVAPLKKKLPDMVKEASSQFTVYEWDKYYKQYRSFPIPSLMDSFYSLDTVVEAAFARLRTGDSLPMLSSVTHTPCWIDPLELIARLLLWQQAGREPHSMDLQLALQRCARENTQAALTAAQALEGEYKELLTYFLGDNATLPQSPTHKAWWVTAALMRPERRVPQELLTPDFADIPPEYFGSPFQWKIVPMTAEHAKTLSEHYPVAPWGEKELTTTSEQWLIVDLPRAKCAPDFLVYSSFDPVVASVAGQSEELFCGRIFLGFDVSLFNQLLLLFPNNPEPLVMDFIAAYRREKYDKTLRFLEKLLELRVPMGPASHLLLALVFLGGAKEPRLYAAAFWRTKVEEGHIDCAELGRLLGQLEAHKWVPTKRFTDIVEKELLAVSPLHSAHLATMLEAMLLEISPEPQVTIKRILEIYYELTAAQGKKLPAPMLPLLDAWATEKSQAAIITKLRKLG